MIQDQIHYNQKNWDKKIARLFCFFFFFCNGQHIFIGGGGREKLFVGAPPTSGCENTPHHRFCYLIFDPMLLGKKYQKTAKTQKNMFLIYLYLF
jgi:hypothetical protein